MGSQGGQKLAEAALEGDDGFPYGSL